VARVKAALRSAPLRAGHAGSAEGTQLAFTNYDRIR
jgi:hypothetical protein